LLKILIYFIQFTFLKKYCEDWLKVQVKKIRNIAVVFFAKTPNLEQLNKAVLYAKQNELTNNLKVIHFLPDLSRTPADWIENITVLDLMYPQMKIDLVLVEGHFCPGFVDRLSQVLHIPKNFMFITCPGEEFHHNLSSFGGVRIIVGG